MWIDGELAAAAACDERGVPRLGRRLELAALRRAGYRDLAFGRIYEGHGNALSLIFRCGTAQQRAQAQQDLSNKLVFGVWNSQDAGGVRAVPHEGRYRFAGAKTWCSGAGTVTRPIVTAALPDGGSQMFVVPMERVNAVIDSSEWKPLGMQGSDSYRVAFDGVELGAGDALGQPRDYERAPWFLAGAIRFVAVQTGGIERLVDETKTYLLERARDGDVLQTARVAEMQIALQSALNWLDAGADAWANFDALPTPGAAERVTFVVEMARTAVERLALETIANAERCVGARGLLEPLPFAGLCRDLQMYLRQPAPDAALLRVGRAAFAEAIARESASSAKSSGTAG